MRRFSLLLCAFFASSCEAVWGHLTEPNRQFDCTAAGSSCLEGQVCNPSTLACEAACASGSICIPCATMDAVALLQRAIETQSDQQTTLIQLTPKCSYTLTEPVDFTMGPNGLAPIRSDVVIEGNGATIVRSKDAAPFRFFYVAPSRSATQGSRLTLRNLTLQGGLSQGGDAGLGAPATPVGPGGGGGGAGFGGAIFSQGKVVLHKVSLIGNEARGGNAAGAASATVGNLPAMIYVKGAGGGGGLRGNGLEGSTNHVGGGGGAFRPDTAGVPQGGYGTTTTEGGKMGGGGGTYAGLPTEYLGSEPGRSATAQEPGSGGAPANQLGWLGGGGGTCFAVIAGTGGGAGGGTAGTTGGGNGGGGGSGLTKPGSGEPRFGGGGGGFYSSGGGGQAADMSVHGGGGGAFGGGGSGGVAGAAGGGGGGVGGGGGGGATVANLAFGGGGGGGGGFGGGGGGGVGSNAAAGDIACAGGAGGFGGGGGIGPAFGSGAASRYGGGAGVFVPTKAAFGGGGMGAGGALFALGGQVELRESKLTSNLAQGGIGGIGGRGLGGGIFGVAAEVSLSDSILSQNTVRNGESRISSVDFAQKPARGAGLFMLDPGAKAPISQTSARVELNDSTTTGNAGDANDTAGADVSLEFEPLGGTTSLGSFRSSGGSSGQTQNAFTSAGGATTDNMAAGCQASRHPAGRGGMLALFGLLGLLFVRRGRTWRRERVR